MGLFREVGARHTCSVVSPSSARRTRSSFVAKIVAIGATSEAFVSVAIEAPLMFRISWRPRSGLVLHGLELQLEGRRGSGPRVALLLQVGALSQQEPAAEFV